MNVFLYGPPGVGKTTVGRLVATRLASRSEALLRSRSGSRVAAERVGPGALQLSRGFGKQNSTHPLAEQASGYPRAEQSSRSRPVAERNSGDPGAKRESKYPVPEQDPRYRAAEQDWRHRVAEQDFSPALQAPAWRFVDLDSLIVSRTGRSIESWFAESETVFRQIERELCLDLAREHHLVVALGAGALLDPGVRDPLTRNHLIVCLTARPATLRGRLKGSATRPLLAGARGREKLVRLLAERAAIYDGFAERIDTEGHTAAQVAGAVLSLLKPRTLQVAGLRQQVVLGYGLLDRLPALIDDGRLARMAPGPTVIVTDRHVQACQGARFPKGTARVVVQPGEGAKTFGGLRRLSRRFVAAGLDRGGTVIAIGGGVVNDLAGFAAATFMRGVRWVSVPTSLLAMVDASVGGKTGIDLPEGKNLVGAFHPASLVVVDPVVLGTLPAEEWTAGMAEVVKHTVIAAPALFKALERGRRFGALADLATVIDVKRAIVERDPFERGEREVLNLGHTIGHGIEAASHYRVRHGEAVAIGLAGAARLSEALGLARRGLADRIERVLEVQGLPVRYAGISAQDVRAAMAADKKTRHARLRFALPRAIGRVVTGVEADERTVMRVLSELRARGSDARDERVRE